MVKKIAKYSKFVLCIALILSLVAPSYAALSASDGSAFVTKAEFDSALADFNARLTTFEAGINSKIDSQVTSYLDRNGIWNGKDIDLPGNIYKIGPSSTDMITVLASSKFTKDGENHDISFCRFPLTNNIPKSGLLFLMLFWRGGTGWRKTTTPSGGSSSSQKRLTYWPEGWYDKSVGFESTKDTNCYFGSDAHCSSTTASNIRLSITMAVSQSSDFSVPANDDGVTAMSWTMVPHTFNGVDDSGKYRWTPPVGSPMVFLGFVQSGKQLGVDLICNSYFATGSTTTDALKAGHGVFIEFASAKIY